MRKMEDRIEKLQSLLKELVKLINQEIREKKSTVPEEYKKYRELVKINKSLIDFEHYLNKEENRENNS